MKLKQDEIFIFDIEEEKNYFSNKNNNKTILPDLNF